ncbi:hypothetical protein NAEGRDRAFT_77696 [Naegleria gruberi]|uniref:Uncharacterized protein n=1 Tax=Naegleria gruberi TaxID=5762 RepID=D2UXP4_NAEGR|nr:uncharacterized protein NAEGRDRAFT_77696 [Naegleria gruberi]EFC50321.1 hypothetical protein NAEGRDRAFT_77696 [Naegleria gruberi]|eukprot:XP_002683065.1 hypothetical protein NAEGRDRAFT_77696 [Naegleria gruberi strain NEG-M]
MLSTEKNGEYQAIQFKELNHSRPSKSLQSTLNEKACFTTSLLVEDEISTKSITRTNIDNTFSRFDNIRILKERSFLNFYFDILYSGIEKVHDLQALEITDMAQRLIVDDKAHRIMVRKSFLVSKLPLLIKKWYDSFGNEKQFYDPFFNCANIKNIHSSYSEKDIRYLTDTSFNSIEKALYMTSKYCVITNHQHILKEIINHCVSLKLIAPENIRMLINDSVIDNEENEDIEIQKNYFSNFLEKNPVEYVVNLVICPRYQAAVIKADFLETSEHYFGKMDCLIRNPSVLDIIQLHGFIPDVLERVFIEMRNIFDTKEDLQHTKFALAFTLLYIIAERFEFKKVKENREIFYMLMDRHFINESALVHLKEWFQNWFEDRLDRFSESIEISNICQDILKELFSVSARIAQAGFGGEVDMEGIQKLRRQYSPSVILKASTCMAKLFVEWYFLKPADLEFKLVPILSFFHEQFGYHVEVGFSAGLLPACLQVFPNLESTREKIPDLVESIYKAFLAKNREVFGFNISSIMLHNLLVQCVHTCTQNIKSLERRKPVVFNYHLPTIQSLLHESYLITGSNIEWQLATQEDSQELHQGKVFLLPPLLGFGNTNVNLSSSASSAVVQTWVEHEFENIYRSLAVSSLTSLTTQGFIMNSTMRVSFNVLVRGYRAMGALNFLKFLLDHIFECLLKEDEEPFDAIRVAEAAAIMFFISAGEDGIDTLLREATNNGLFEFLLQHHHEQHKNFLETGVQIYNRPPNPKTPSVKGIQALSNVEYLYILSSLFGYFTVFVLSIRERRLSNNEGIQRFIFHLIEEHTHKIIHEEKHFMTHFTLSFFEQLSKIPNLILQTQHVLKKQPECFPNFCQIVTRASIGNSFLVSFGRNLGFSDGLVLTLLKHLISTSVCDNVGE